MIKSLKEFEQNKWFLTIWIALMCMFCIIVFYTFVTIPYTGDISVFMASANLVKYQPDFGIMAVFESWELKGIVNRLLIYFLYRITCCFVEYTNIISFQICSKIIYGIFVIGIMFICIMIIPEITKIQRIKLGIVFYLSVFATYTAVQLQAEMSIVVFSIVVFACLCSGNKKLSILAGIIGALFFFSKSVFFLMYFSAVAGVFVYNSRISNQKSIMISIITMVVCEVLLLFAVKMIYPQEFYDMKNAAEFQTTLFSKDSNVSLITIFTCFSANFTQSCIAIPFLLIGFLSTVALLIKAVKEKNWVRILAITLCWLLPIDIIVASNTYFIYHYFLLMLPGIICIFTYISEIKIYPIVVILSGFMGLIVTAGCWIMKDGLEQLPIINYSTVLLVIFHLFIMVLFIGGVFSLSQYQPAVLFCVLSVSVFLWMNYSSVMSPKYRNLMVLRKKSVELCSNIFPEDFGDEPVLYMDAGVAPFYVDAPSYSRYFFNLPLQRWSEGKKWKVQKDEYNSCMNYKGKYIVYDSWFKLDKYPQLKEKIEAEYVILENSGLWFYSPDWNVFSLSMPPNKEDINKISSTCIMIRKENIAQ